ncbi:BQ5605_C037g11587 [Microbotryum silenes-dioicae]|uniref:BQ5605_C037g11587 protein n=1 Tax=Microbotryum silenes-dioicae TaxID=796604 RepID=A0A2X0N8N9_9BASI|nr:BQ5605_C037g11587 [Microbotryum silenes-dioicae]
MGYLEQARRCFTLDDCSPHPHSSNVSARHCTPSCMLGSNRDPIAECSACLIYVE